MHPYALSPAREVVMLPLMWTLCATMAWAGTPEKPEKPDHPLFDVRSTSLYHFQVLPNADWPVSAVVRTGIHPLDVLPGETEGLIYERRDIGADLMARAVIDDRAYKQAQLELLGRSTAMLEINMVSIELLRGPPGDKEIPSDTATLAKILRGEDLAALLDWVEDPKRRDELIKTWSVSGDVARYQASCARLAWLADAYHLAVGQPRRTLVEECGPFAALNPGENPYLGWFDAIDIRAAAQESTVEVTPSFTLSWYGVVSTPLSGRDGARGSDFFGVRVSHGLGPERALSLRDTGATLHLFKWEVGATRNRLHPAGAEVTLDEGLVDGGASAASNAVTAEFPSVYAGLAWEWVRTPRLLVDVGAGATLLRGAGRVAIDDAEAGQPDPIFDGGLVRNPAEIPYLSARALLMASNKAWRLRRGSPAGFILGVSARAEAIERASWAKAGVGFEDGSSEGLSPCVSIAAEVGLAVPHRQ